MTNIKETIAKPYPDDGSHLGDQQWYTFDCEASPRWRIPHAATTRRRRGFWQRAHQWQMSRKRLRSHTPTTDHTLGSNNLYFRLRSVSPMTEVVFDIKTCMVLWEHDKCRLEHCSNNDIFLIAKRTPDDRFRFLEALWTWFWAWGQKCFKTSSHNITIVEETLPPTTD